MCYEPIVLKNKIVYKSVNGKIQQVGQSVPCGKCNQCVKAKLSAWLFRLDKEIEVSKNPLFITLTYDNKSIPTTLQGLPTLRKSDCQTFMKKLRKAYCKKMKLTKSGIRYFIVGEYGAKYGRPHYHIIMFNLLDHDLIHECWDNGHTLTLPLKEGGNSYVLKYVLKKQSKPKEGQQREFSLVSGGFGKNYLTPQIISYHCAAIENSHITLKGGRKVPIPKYFKDHIYTAEMRKKVSVYMEKLSLELEKQRYKDYKFQNPTFTEELIIRNLNQIRFNVQLDQRKNEIF